MMPLLGLMPQAPAACRHDEADGLLRDSPLVSGVGPYAGLASANLSTHRTSRIGALKSRPARISSAVILGAVIVAGGACAATSVAAPRPAPALATAEVVVTLRIGESVTPDGLGATVTLVDVTDDSRCPSDATCVWAGDATVTLRVAAPDAAAATIALHTGQADRGSAVVAGRRLTLTRLDPLPTAGQPVPREGYRAAIAISR